MGNRRLAGYHVQKKSKTKDGDTRMDDVTSDLEYMVNIMPRVGAVWFVTL